MIDFSSSMDLASLDRLVVTYALLSQRPLGAVLSYQCLLRPLS